MRDDLAVLVFSGGATAHPNAVAADDGNAAIP